MATYLSAAQRDDKTVLNVLANDTGGVAFPDNNDLLGSLAKGLDANRAYYALAYYPEETKDLKKFRNISIKVRNHPEYSVRSQKGYQPSERAREERLEQSLTPEQCLVKAMAEPLASADLAVDSSAYYYQQEGDQSQVHLRTYISSEGLDYRLENERYQFKLEVVIHIYDVSGRPAWSHSDTVSGNLKPEHLDIARKKGLTIEKALSIPPGLYQIRLGVQEDSTGKIGTSSSWVEVPDLKRNRLAMSSVLIGTDIAGRKASDNDSADESVAKHTFSFFKKQDKLAYAFRLYHAPLDPNGACPLEIQLQFVSRSQTIAGTGWGPVSSHQVSQDALGILVAGEVPLAEIKAGIYELIVTIRDPKSKKTLQNSVQFGID
jgi:hypothetical protein